VVYSFGPVPLPIDKETGEICIWRWPWTRPSILYTRDTACSLIAAFAWPAAVLFIFWLFRQKLVELLPLLILKYKDWQISFGLDKAEADAKKLPSPPVD
jgi:hypothetical protein